MKLTKPKHKIKPTDFLSWKFANEQGYKPYILFYSRTKEVQFYNYTASIRCGNNKGDIVLCLSSRKKYYTVEWDEFSEEYCLKEHPMCNAPEGLKQWRLLHNL